jgi:hypothetical protein
MASTSASSGTVSSADLKSAVARLVCLSVTKMCNSGGSVLAKFGSIRHKLETEFGCDLRSSSHRRLIKSAIVATVKQGILKDGLFTCGELLNSEEELTRVKQFSIVEVEDEDELVYSFIEYTESAATHPRASSIVPDDPDELVYAFGKFPQPSDEVLQASTDRLVRAAVSAREELSVRSTRQRLEAEFSCDLSARKQVVVMYIAAALKNEILHAAPAKKEVNGHKLRKLG